MLETDNDPNITHPFPEIPDLDNMTSDQRVRPLKDRTCFQGEVSPLLRKTDDDSNCPRQSRSRVNINVGGVLFQTLESTISNTPLRTDRRFRSHYDEDRKEYFFDRDPDVFLSVLNYWRTGKLHLPQTRCGSHINDELGLWGLSKEDIQPCCWRSYQSGLETVTSLKRLRRYTSEGNGYCQYKTSSVCGRHRLNMWYLLTKPSHSTAAKVLEYSAMMFAMLAIFSFCASTHPLFQIDFTSEKGNNSSLQMASNESTLRVEQVITNTSRRARIHQALAVIDIVCLTFFTIEYLVRLVCAPKLFHFVLSATSVIDIVAILPDYVEILVYTIHPEISASHMIMDLLPFLRLMRVCRIFRIIRRVPGLWIMIYTLQASYRELSLMLIFLLVGTLLFSSVIYFVDDNKIFVSIPHSFWWAIVTMTTVGYGDMAPVTPLGQLIGSVTAVCGVLMLGFTVPSLVTNFTTYYSLMEYEVRQKKFLGKTRD